MKLTETLILAILVIFSLAVAPVAIGFSGWDDGWSGGWDDGWSGGWDDGWSGGWDDDWSNPWDDDGAGGVDDGDSDTWDDWGDDDPGDPSDDPAHWNKLDPQSVLEDSPDDTVVYANLRNQCIDDNNVLIRILKHTPHYNLIMSGDDLVIRNLEENYWDNGKIVTLSCNGVPSFFKLTITPVNDAPEIINLDDITIYMKDGPLSINLINHEYDVDNTHAQLSWDVTQRRSSLSVFESALDGKMLTLTPRSRGAGYLWFRLEDPEGLYDEQRIVVRVLSGDRPVPGDDDEEDKDRIGIFVSSIRIHNDGVLEAGDQLEAYITVKNSGNVDLDNVKITMLIQDIAARGVAGPFDLNDGETVSKLVRLDIEEDAVISEDVYDVRFTVSNDNSRRVVYREVDVELA
jgi:hypothetical protein